jgi:ketosteroid isomerase-like protein
MRQKSNSNDLSSEKFVKGIRQATRKRYSAEEKIRIVLDGLAASTRSPSCAAAKASPRPLHSWSKESLEAGKRRLAGDTTWTVPHAHATRATTRGGSRANSFARRHRFWAMAASVNSNWAPRGPRNLQTAKSQDELQVSKQRLDALALGLIRPCPMAGASAPVRSPIRRVAPDGPRPRRHVATLDVGHFPSKRTIGP